MNEYQKILEDFRSHYKKMYDVNLDDEVLYFFIRVNEMQLSIKKEIASIPQLTFKTGKDYFLYGLGKTLYPTLIALFAALVVLIAVFVDTSSSNTASLKNPVLVINGKPCLAVKDNNTGRVYYLPLNSN